MSNNTLQDLVRKTKETFKKEGFRTLVYKTKGYLAYQIRNSDNKNRVCKDILFISGCGLPHPERYRIDHQIEQLESYGLTCDKIHYSRLTLDELKFYRGFIFFRCPVIPVVEEFIEKAKENNKTCFYDIDDLVFDTQYTDQIKYLDTMSKADRKEYDDGVRSMKKTMELCEYGITSTGRLQTEMKKTLKEVYLNRNVASEAMLKYSEDALKINRSDKRIYLGYFSGSITHNDDFKLIMPTIVKLLKQYDNLYLKIVGLLDLPPEMESVRNKVVTAQFSNWKELPKIIRSVDINLAPLEDTLFNEAKSENKWTEAALVKVPTVASDVGAFHEVVENEKTGLLCRSKHDWGKALESLIVDEKLRKQIGENAYREVREHHVTTCSGKEFSDFINSKLRKNVYFVLPSINISGGILVAMKHAAILKKHGYDVTLINAEKIERVVKIDGTELNVISVQEHEILNYVNTVVATMWVTLEYVSKFGKCSHRKYLVQNFETNFYKLDHPDRRRANATYNQFPGIEYITISKWCKEWLEKDYHDEVKYAPNGINLALFTYKERSMKDRKIRILIEGDSKSFYKNTDESFRIVDNLDRSKFEIHYLSYYGEPKKSYRYDKYYHQVPHSEVGKIYQKCDILLKSSILESFSYPPLEMMATGGFCVVRPNEGNIEYLKDGVNCLFYESEEEAIKKINDLASNKRLRNELIKNSKKTVLEHNWDNLEKKILKLYES